MDDFWDGNATLGGLQIPATKRADAARFILNDLKAAIGLIPEARANLHSRSKYSGLRVNRETAMILAMRVALYEVRGRSITKELILQRKITLKSFLRK